MTNIEIIIIKNESLKNTAFGSFETCKNVYKCLLTLYPEIRMTICSDEYDLIGVVDRNPNLVLLTNKIMIDSYGKKIWLSEYFEANNINYTGSSKEVLKYDVNKTSSKLQILSHGIETAGFFTAVPDQYKSSEDMPIPFPLFIKPNNSANSDGIDNNSFVVNFAGFKEKVKELHDIYKEPILVEEYLSGREFTVSIVNADTMLIAPIEIIAPLKGDLRILSKKIKSENSEVLKEITDINIYQKVSTIALAAFKALGARDFGRIDIKMDAYERCYFIEANLTPGMTKGSSYFPKSYELNSLLKYDEVLNLIIRSAIKRYPIAKVINPIKMINKYIEIVMIAGDIKQKNIAIDIDAKIISNILSKIYTKVSISVIRTKDNLNNLIKKKPDLVFSGVKYFTFYNKDNESETIWLNDYLDDNNIPYIGSSRRALENEYDKCVAKNIMQKSNINTADFFTSHPGEYKNKKSLPIKFPLFIKPITGGDSRGIDQDSIVNNFNDFEKKVSSIHNDQQSNSLIETYLSGKEYSVAILENHIKNTITAMPVEIIPKSSPQEYSILDFNAKKNDSEEVVAVLSLEIRNQVSSLAIIAFKALNGKSFGRIDIKMNEHGVPYFMEANFMPGLKQGYFYRACFLNQNMSYDQMILMIARTGMSSKRINA
jgi:D-alanine-D-alanine ligase